MGSNETNRISIDAALEAMSHGVRVITANRRLVPELKGRYDHFQASRGQQAWESANILSWGDWMQSQFQELQDLGLTDKSLLTPQQSRLLWEQIIQQSSQDRVILITSSVARVAQEAWGITQSWLINRRELLATANSENEQFLFWADRFESRCHQNNWIDASIIPNIVKEQIVNGIQSVPDRIILAGFDEMLPQQNALLDAISEQGSEIFHLSPGQAESLARRYQAVDKRDEIYTAARWAINRLQTNQHARIGIVVPKLADIRRELELSLDRCLNPISVLPGSHNTKKAYNISLGVPLAQSPLIVDAFLILRFAQGRLGSNELSRLLRSPFIAGCREEGERRARLDAHIRSSLGEHEISLDTLIRKLREVSGIEANSCPILLTNMEEFRKTLDHLQKRQPPQNWTDEFQRILTIFGWCRSVELGSHEYQQLEKFNSLFSPFQQLSQIKHTMWLEEAIKHLHAIAAETAFQAQGGSDAQIQVLGILEATGLKFDHLWVIGLSDDVWPEPAYPNPLLPISTQRKLGLPHSSPQRELDYASTITQRLLSGAQEVVVSHALTDGKSELRVSPLIVNIPEVLIDDLDVAEVGEISRLGFDPSELEQLQDSTGPALPAGSHLTGGSRLLADQSACPFRAFANHRLGTTGVEEPVSGVDARTKGVITHRVLQLLWQHIGDQERLLGMDSLELQQLIDTTVSQELSVLKKRRPETFTPRFIEIEQERLVELITQWLELEKQRAPFKAVSLEQKERISLSGLELEIRADRIDQLENGTKLIIDYKTGKNLSYKGWFEQRIEEPQLPLYATKDSEEITGICLAGVNRTKLSFSGVTEQDDMVPGVKGFSAHRESQDYSGWSELKSSWKQRLELLAEEVLSGRADVMPKNPRVCDHCQLHSLCRVHEWEEDL